MRVYDVVAELKLDVLDLNLDLDVNLSIIAISVYPSVNVEVCLGVGLEIVLEQVCCSCSGKRSSPRASRRGH